MSGLINAYYLFGSAILALAASRSRSRSHSRWWLFLSASILLIGLLRIQQAGLWLDYLRTGFRMTGLYVHHRSIQIAGITAFIVTVFIACKCLRAPTDRRSLTFAIGSFCGLVIFAVIRSSSLHWTDIALQQQFGPISVSDALQVFLLSAISGAALAHMLPPNQADPDEA